MAEVERRAVAEQQDDRRAVHADRHLHPAARRQADEDHRGGHGEREGDEMQPSAQLRFFQKDLPELHLGAVLLVALALRAEFLRRHHFAWFLRTRDLANMPVVALHTGIFEVRTARGLALTGIRSPVCHIAQHRKFCIKRPPELFLQEIACSILA